MTRSTISKSQLAWLFLRGFGIYLGYLALQGIISMICLVSVTEQLNGTMIVPLFFATAGSVYFLLFGESAHQLLMRESSISAAAPSVSDSRIPRTPSASAEKEDPNTTLTPSEKESFTRWLEENPEWNGLHLDDQIARFRDYQKGR